MRIFVSCIGFINVKKLLRNVVCYILLCYERKYFVQSSRISKYACVYNFSFAFTYSSIVNTLCNNSVSISSPKQYKLLSADNFSLKSVFQCLSRIRFVSYKPADGKQTCFISAFRSYLEFYGNLAANSICS